jgi:hypothetical protein
MLPRVIGLSIAAALGLLLGSVSDANPPAGKGGGGHGGGKGGAAHAGKAAPAAKGGHDAKAGKTEKAAKGTTPHAKGKHHPVTPPGHVGKMPPPEKPVPPEERWKRKK